MNILRGMGKRASVGVVFFLIWVVGNFVFHLAGSGLGGVSAGSANYDGMKYFISDYAIDAKVEKTGDVTVEEKLDYTFNYSARGIYRVIGYKDFDGINDIKVSAVDKSGSVVNFRYDKNDTGSENTYTLTNEGDAVRIKAYKSTNYDSRTFSISYRIKDGAKRYLDTATLGWIIFDQRNENNIKNMKVSVALPGTEEVQAWGHGPLNGVVDIGENSAIFSVTDLAEKTNLEITLIFDKGALSSAPVLAQNMKATILEREKKWADEANNQRRWAQIRLYGGAAGSAVLLVLYLAAFIFLYIRYDREHKGGYEGDYYRDLPGEYSPAEMGALYRFGRLVPDDITATLLDLVRRKYLVLSMEKVTKGGFLFIPGKETDVARFAKSDTYSSEGLKLHESHLVDFLIGEMGDGSSIVIQEIESKVKSRSYAESFNSGIKAFYDLAKEEAERNGFFEHRMNRYRGGAIGLGVLGAAFGIFVSTTIVLIALGITLIICGIGLVIYSATIKKRSVYGADQFAKWKAFRKFLLHFSQIDRASLPSLIVWEHYLVYAISLGVAEEVSKQMAGVYDVREFSDPTLTYLGMHYAFGMNPAFAASSMSSAISHSVMSVSQVASSTMSSSTGGGGGFSGGGGFGGGGGGGGAF